MSDPGGVFRAGFFREDITPGITEETGPLPLLGWGDPHHRATRAETPVFARAAAFEDVRGGRLLFACLELCFISESLRLGIMKRLREVLIEEDFKEHEVVLVATHTHNAPGGFCHSILYNVPSKGYRPEIFETYVAGAVRALMSAWRFREPVTPGFASIEIPLSEPVAFNRSIRAWNANPDTVKYKFKDRDRALYRWMDQMTFTRPDGGVVGILNWFPVHCTTMHRDFMAIHSDNKGEAARVVEAAHPGCVAIFCQGASGDVSPNFRRYLSSIETRGTHRDDRLSCRDHGGIQARYALQLVTSSSPMAEAGIESIFGYYDATRIPIPAEWVGGRRDVFTGPAALGCPFMAGTAEGGGIPRIMVFSIEWVLRVVYFLKRRRLRTAPHGAKIIAVNLSEGRVLGDARPEDLPLPSALDPLMRVMRFWSRIRVFRGQAMTPTVMPVQLFRMGQVGFVVLPGEFTTQSGVRIREMLLPILEPMGIRRIVISGYGNSYAGYVTTEEEYQLQLYEGACTHFGRYTLLGYQAILRQQAIEWAGGVPRGARIPERPAPEMKPSSYLRRISSEFFRKRVAR